MQLYIKIQYCKHRHYKTRQYACSVIMSRFSLSMTDREHNVCDINPVHQVLASGTAEVGGAYVPQSEWIEYFECVCLCVSNRVPCVVGG